MAQTVQILRTSAVNNSPAALLPGALSVELSASWTKLWVGAAAGNRLLLSSNPADTPLGTSAFLPLKGGTLTGTLTLNHPGGNALVVNTPIGQDAHIQLHNGTTGDWLLASQGATGAGEFWLYNNKTSAVNIAVQQDNTVRVGGTLIVNHPGGNALAVNVPTGQDAHIQLHSGTTGDWLLAAQGATGAGEFWVFNNKTSQLPFAIKQDNSAVFSGQVAVNTGGVLPGLNIGSTTGGGLAQLQAGIGAGSPADAHIVMNNNRYQWKFGVQGFASPDQFWFYNVTRGAIGIIMDSVSGACYNQSGSWTAFSDGSLKEQVSPYSRGLEAILALNPVTFRYKAGTPAATEVEPSEIRFGLIAEDVEPYIPEIVGSTNASVKGEDRVVKTLTPTDLTYVLINAVKELKAELDQLKADLPPGLPTQLPATP